MSGLEISESPRILIVRFGMIGDAILTMPLACAIRQRFPHAFIGWAITPPASSIVDRHVAIDKLIHLQPNWSRSFTSIRQTRSEVRTHRFDTAIDCHGTFASALLCRISGAKQRIGLAAPHSRIPARLMNNHVVRPVFHHVTDRTLELLTPLGIHSPSIQWQVPLSERAQSWADGWRRTIESPAIAVLNPGGTSRAKLWEPDRFAATARYLSEKHGFVSVVVWRTSQEEKMARQIAHMADGSAVMSPVTDLHHLGALIETSNLFISGDTGPLHLAVALGVPTIGLYGATEHRISGPYRQTVIQNMYRFETPDKNDAMRTIKVQQVCAAIDELLSDRPISQVRRTA